MKMRVDSGLVLSIGEIEREKKRNMNAFKLAYFYSHSTKY